MLSFDELSIASVSGMIAGAVAFLQILLPLAMPIILLSLLRFHDNTSSTSAVAWSRIGGFLHGSRWPLLLRADSAAFRGVPKSITLVITSTTIIAVLIAVAAVVTPLGLYEEVVPTDQSSSLHFHYLPDQSTFGYGTPPRVDLPWARYCSGIGYTACPGSFSNVTQTSNSSGDFYDVYAYDSSIPKYYIDILQSGLSGMAKSVSSIFDIQSRSYTWSTLDNRTNAVEVDNGKTHPVTVFRQVGSLIMEPKAHVVEGLVVDMVSGGIGFRNHSGPPYSAFGSTWTEDLLFVDPETTCVDTNLTLDFMIPLVYSASGKAANVVMTDHGGFANLDKDYPEWDRMDPQNMPSFELRAYKAAWLHNAYTMAIMNVTNLRNKDGTGPPPFSYLNSFVGKEFPLMKSDPSSIFSAPTFLSYDSIMTTALYGSIMYGLDRGRNESSTPSIVDPSENFTLPAEQPLYPNIFNITTEWDEISVLCTGSGGQDNANISNFMASCGMMFGAPRRKGGGNSLAFEPGSNWTVPLYSCISSTKALVKSVTFQFNGSDALTGLHVTGIREKSYNNERSKPLWGVENTDVPLSELQPLWGLVSNGSLGNATLSLLRKESLYLPGYPGRFTMGVSESPSADNVPGSWFHVAALASLFDIQKGASDHADYTGKSNYALYRRWQEATRTPERASEVLNLVWTDIAANSVVGTRGMHSTGTQTGLVPSENEDEAVRGSVADIRITNYARRIRYHLKYGIPAVLVLLVVLTVLVVTIGVLMFGQSSLEKMRTFLMMTSQGRIHLSNGEISNAPSGDWIVSEGGKGIVTVRIEQKGLKRSSKFTQDTRYPAHGDALLQEDHVHQEIPQYPKSNAM